MRDKTTRKQRLIFYPPFCQKFFLRHDVSLLPLMKRVLYTQLRPRHCPSPFATQRRPNSQRVELLLPCPHPLYHWNSQRIREISFQILLGVGLALCLLYLLSTPDMSLPIFLSKYTIAVALQPLRLMSSNSRPLYPCPSPSGGL